MSVGSAIGGAEESVDAVAVLAVLAIVVYIVYKYPDILASLKADFVTGWSGITGAVQPIINDYNSGVTNVDTALNDYEANTPSELGTTIFAGPSPTIDLPSTAPGLPAGYDPTTGEVLQ